MSESRWSFGVTPSLPRSIPSSPLPQMAFPRMASTLESPSRETPSPPLNAMVLASPAAVPPTTLLPA